MRIVLLILVTLALSACTITYTDGTWTLKIDPKPATTQPAK